MFNAEMPSVQSWVTLSARTRGQPRFWMHVTLMSSATDEQTYPTSAHWSRWNWYQLAENNLTGIIFYGIFFSKNVYCSISGFRKFRYHVAEFFVDLRYIFLHSFHHLQKKKKKKVKQHSCDVEVAMELYSASWRNFPTNLRYQLIKLVLTWTQHRGIVGDAW